MTDAVHELLDKSEQSINAANLLLRNDYYDFAASRAYYAMFYAVELPTHTVSKRKANQTIAEAGELLAEIKRHLAVRPS